MKKKKVLLSHAQHHILINTGLRQLSCVCVPRGPFQTSTLHSRVNVGDPLALRWLLIYLVSYSFSTRAYPRRRWVEHVFTCGEQTLMSGEAQISIVG